MKYRNRIPEPGITISGFADCLKKKKKKKLMPTEKTKVYTESDTDTKKGQIYSTVNLGIHVGLQSSPL